MNLDYLMSQLYHKDLKVRTTFIDNLGEDNNREVVAYLIPLLKDQEEDIRCAVAKVLGDLDDETVVEPLINLLSVETELKVKKKAHESLGKLKDARAIPVLFRDLHEYIGGISAGQALASFGEQVHDEVLNLFINSDYVTKINAAVALGCLRDGRRRPSGFLLEQFDLDNGDDFRDYRSTVLIILGVLICELPIMLFRDE